MDNVRIASRGESFRRAGIQFTREGQVFGPGDLTPEQIDAIREERNLIVTPATAVRDEAAPAESETGKKAKAR